jgi:Tfp pilus assembly major pilin PilA
MIKVVLWEKWKSRGSGSVDIETKGQTKEKPVNSIEQLTDQVAAARRKRASNARMKRRTKTHKDTTTFLSR